MKPDGRALDIAAIGLGQAGGNLAAEFYRRGYRALALNTAQTDLAALEPGGLVPGMPPERRLYIGLDGYDGAGADPGYGRDCIHAHADRIKAQVQKLGHDADAVIICAGLGGGTGSALPTLVEVLDDDDLPLVALMTLPTEAESGLAKVNAVRTVNDVVDANLVGWIFIDNGRLAALNQDVSIAEYYSRVNGQVIEPLDALNGLNARDDLRPIRSFDGEDFRKLLLAGGVLNYATSEIEGLTVDHVLEGVRQHIEESEVMPGGFDLKRVSYLGLILEAPASVLSQTSIMTFESLHQSLKRATDGAAIYQGTYRNDDGAPIVLRLLAVTQSLPRRIRQLLGDAKREGQVIGSKVQEDLPSLELGEVQSFDLFRTHARPSERPRRARASGRRAPRATLDGLPSEVSGVRRPPEAPAPDQPAEPAASAQGGSGWTAPQWPPPRRGLSIPEAPTEAALSPLDDPSRMTRPPGGRRRPAAPLVAAPRAEPGDSEPSAIPSPVPTSADPADAADGAREPDQLRGPGRGPEPDYARGSGHARGSDHAREPGQPRESDQARGSDQAREPSGGPEPDRPAELDAPPAASGDSTLLSNDLADAWAKAATPEPTAEPVPPAERGTREIDVIGELAGLRPDLGEEAPERPLDIAGARRPPPADPDADTGDLPSPAIYERLVREYQRVGDPERRRALAERLERDSVSDNSAVRYYAVEAMAKLDLSTFGNALLAATGDVDEAVRHLAVQALKG